MTSGGPARGSIECKSERFAEGASAPRRVIPPSCSRPPSSTASRGATIGVHVRETGWVPVALPSIRDQALEVARGWSGAEVPSTWRLTATLFEVLAGDQELLTVASGIPAQRLPALLFVASAQYLAARYPADPFSAYFPVPGGDQPPLDDRFAERYRGFCLDHRDELAEVWTDRAYQMNEVARSAQIALALGVIHDAMPGRGVALVDLGTGAGLGLFPDRYRYRFSDGGEGGAADSTVPIACELRGPLSPRCRRLPVIEHRVGIDINPIDLRDPEACAWLMACLPPEVGALTRAVGAMDVVRNVNLTVVCGAANEMLGDVLAGMPDGLLVCVVDAYTAVFFDDTEQQRLGHLIAAQARSRDLAWISLDPLVPLGTDARKTVQGADAPERLVEANRRGGVFGVLSITAHLEGSQTTRLLATAHPSGTRMEWLDDTTAIRDGG